MMTVVNISREHESRIMREHHKSLVNVLNCSIALTDFGVLSIDKATCINIVRVENADTSSEDRSPHITT